ncbi:DUF4376 domain-containing protein [Citrobacter braakii]|nr:DUF4376 domain-containing protein [Citrobacter braakii]
MKIQQILNPHYLESGAIDCGVLFEGMDEAIPYTATPDDTAPTGQHIWQELQSGKWGEIAPFTETPEILETARTAKRQEIEAWRTEQEAQPHTFEWNDHTWNGGADSMARLAPVAMAAKVSGARAMLGWSDVSNNSVSLTMKQLKELAGAMAQAMVTEGSRIHERQRQMKDEVAALQTLEDIRAYRVGWPEVGSE